ncbi:hypothetical protein PAEVO_28340 [Paenibacillus sp. GM2FR]|uniref:hypothetical protein n=1 Tax=Paenibacillus sp. GM2FR TaxID=2059268 RepID=UPI000C271D9A|nr:hypothetical protein [Paenibacillus sp. GM2FR]PJN56111.1 hypothetical protein PAEVO_28340 [Paenibacillus sp. GM2FR]
MAVEIGELRARMTAEAQGLKAEIKAVKQEISGLGDQGKKTASDIKSMDTAFDHLGASKDKIGRLTSFLDNVNAKIELQRKKLSELKESYDNTFNDQKKSKLQEQILNTEAALLKLTQSSDQTAQKIWELEDQAQKAGNGFEVLNNSLKEIGLSSGQIDMINKSIQNANPELLEEQLRQVREQLRMIGLDAKHIEKIEQELKQANVEVQNTKKGIDGLASGLTALGAGMATRQLIQTFNTLAKEAQGLATSYLGLSEVSKALHVDTEKTISLAEELSDRWGLSRTAMADTVKTYLTAGLTLEQTKEIMTATADAAVYNREAHLTWDEAIKQVAQGVKMGNSELTDAAGITTNLSVMYDRYAKTIGTTAAKLTEAQKLQAAYNGIMAESAMFAGNADSAMTGYTGTQATFNQTIEMARVELGESFLPVMGEIMQRITPMIKDFVQWAEANKEVVAGLAAGSIAVLGLITVLGTLVVSIGAVTAALRAMNLAMGPIGWVITALSLVAAGVGAYKLASDAASESVLKFAANQEQLNQKLAESPVNRTAEDVKKLQGDIETLNEILERRKELEEQLNEMRTKYADHASYLEHGTGFAPLEVRKVAEEFKTLNTEYEKLNGQLKDMDFSNAEDAAIALKNMKAEVEQSTPALIEMAKAEMQDVAAKNSKVIEMEKTLKRYKELSAVQKLDEAQKAELVSVTNTLKNQYPGLQAHMDKEGRLRIENIGYIEDQIGVEKNMITASVESAKAQITNLKETTKAQKAAVEAQIKNYQALAKVMGAISGKALDIGMTEGKGSLARVGGMLGGIVSAGVKAQANAAAAKMAEEQNKYAAAELEADRALSNLTSGNLDAFAYQPRDLSGGGTDDEKKKKKKGKKEKSGKSAAELAKEQRQAAYDAAMATARYNAEYYDQTADQQLKALKKIQANHKQHLKETLEDQRELNLQMKRLQEDSAKSNYEASATWIERQERKMEESYKSEVQIAQMKVDMWTKVRDRYKKDSEYYKAADEELKRARDELNKAQYAASSEWISKEERRMQDSYKSETQIAQMKIDSWTRVRDRYHKDSEEYKKADEEVYRARKSLLKSQFADSEEWIAKEERRMEEAGKTENEITQMKLAAWTRVRDRYHKDSDEYKRADEEVYRARKALIQDMKKETDDFYNAQKKKLDESLKAELDGIEARKKAYVDAQNEKIKAIDDLIAKEQELNVDEDYETQLAKKLARQQELSTAVSPEGRKALADITEEIERMQLERSRELRKRDLEDQKQKLVDEKDEKEKAYDDERRDTEDRYNALKDAFDSHKDDIQFIENAIKDFRIGANETANQQILSDLDQFVSAYNAKLSNIAKVSDPSIAANADLDEYNANKDAWSAAKARGDTDEMARLTARNEELRRLYGVDKDTGKLQAFKDGGIVQGSPGEAVPVIAHAGEMYLNPEQQNTLWKLVSGQAAAPTASKAEPVIMQTVNHIDMSIERVEVQDPTDAEILYTERERTFRRLATTGGGK